MTLLAGLLIFANVPIGWFNLTRFFNVQKFGSTITTIATTDIISNFPSVFNTDVNNLNADKFENNSYGSQLTISSSTIAFLTNGYITSTSTTGSSFAGTLTDTNTGTSTFSGGLSLAGLNLTKGITIASGYGGLVSNSTATSTLSNGLILSNGCIYLTPTGTCLLPLNLAAQNVWTGLQQFSYTATSTWSKDLNSGGLIAANYFFASSTTATSTFANGIVSQTASTSAMIISNACTGCSSATIISAGFGNFNGGTPSSASVTVTCPSPKLVSGGGIYGVGTPASTGGQTDSSYPSSPNVWSGTIYGPNGSTAASGATLYAVCINP